MARMLQALKNLEARGQKAPPRSADAPVEEAKSAPLVPPRAEQIEAAGALEARSGEMLPVAATQVVSTIDFAAAQLASLNFGVEQASLPREPWPAAGAGGPALGLAVEQALGPVVERAADIRLPVVDEERSLEKAPPAPQVRPVTAIERAAARTLNNPPQARPVVDLADRLEGEANQTGSQTIVLVGLGSGRGTAEALVLAGTLLAERRQREVLLVDADLARRGLSAALECAGHEGFADALASNRSLDAVAQRLATRNLRLLPAGRGADIDVKLAESRLEAMLKGLGQAYGLVLIDGGQAGSELSAALARQADATYLVVELGAVEAAQAQAALRDLRAAGGRVLGCIAT